MKKNNNEVLPSEWSEQTNFQRAIVIIFILIILFIVFQIVSWLFKEKEKDFSLDAYVLCKYEIEKRLKAPSTADFPASKGRVEKQYKRHKYVVNSYVDAENGFGTKLRSDWSCTAKFNGGDEDDSRNWQVRAKLHQ